MSLYFLLVCFHAVVLHCRAEISISIFIDGSL